MAPLIGTLGCTLSASITALTSETIPVPAVKGLQKIYFQSQSVTLSEGSFGVFNILSDEKATQNLTVNLSLSGPSGRFQPLPKTLTIPEGSYSTSFILQSIEDNIYQGDVDFRLTISSPDSGLSISSEPMTVTLIDNDSIPTITVSNVSVSENAGTARFILNLDRPSSQDIQVHWATANGTALAGTNYVSGSGVATISAGALSFSVEISIIDTLAVCEADRVFYLNLSSPLNAILGTPQAQGTITENDFPSLSIADTTINEGFVGGVPVSLSQACPSFNVTVDYSFTDGTAASVGADPDYIKTSGTLIIPAGQTSKLLGVTTLKDSILGEYHEDLTINLANPTHATLGSSTATITIEDLDPTVLPANDVTFVSAGPRHACAVRGGQIFCWGINGNGELGNGTFLPSYNPIEVNGIFFGATKVVTNGIMTGDTRDKERSCAIVSGAAKCWGFQTGYGELGNGGNTPSAVPVNVAGLGSGVTDIDISDSGTPGFACAVHSGAAKCWGNNASGQLGDGTTTSSLVPVTVSGLSSGVISIATGSDHACAVLGVTGTIKCWGANNLGQLGDGTTNNSLVPVLVSGITDGSGATKVSAGNRHSCSLVSGAVKCWGHNNYGQLGDGTNTNSYVPVATLGLTSGVQDIAAAGDSVGGNALSCAIDSLGAVKCWGENSMGQVGDGTTSSRNSPVQVQGLTSGFSKVSVSPGTACALKSTGQAYCWGNNTSGQLGLGWGGFSYQPGDTTNMSSQITAVTVGTRSVCAIKNGALWCWGNNSTGNLGIGNTVNQGSPVAVVGLGSGVTSVSMEDDTSNTYQHTCAVHNGSAKCWGDNTAGQLGIGGGGGGAYSTPQQVSGLTSGVISVASARGHSCALLANGGVQCWGANANGQLGNNSLATSLTPVSVIGITNATAVAVTGTHSCAIDAGALKCWGSNANGQLGDGTGVDRFTPVNVLGMTSGVTSVSVNSSGFTSGSTCAVINGSAKCWGYGTSGALGIGDLSSPSIPTQVLGFTSGVHKVTIFANGGCLLTDQGAVHCWGGNGYSVVNPSLSVSIALSPLAQAFAPAGILDLATGGLGTGCLITPAQSLKCWGSLKQTGTGTTSTDVLTPLEVLFPPGAS